MQYYCRPMTEHKYIAIAHANALKKYCGVSTSPSRCGWCGLNFDTKPYPCPERIVISTAPTGEYERDWSPGKIPDSMFTYCPGFKTWIVVDGTYCSEKCVLKQSYRNNKVPITNHMLLTVYCSGPSRNCKNTKRLPVSTPPFLSLNKMFIEV